MNKLLILIFFTLQSAVCFAIPELKGTPQDLRGLLYPSENIVTIHGKAKEKAYSDKAIVSLVITTEEEQLADAIASNSTLRNKLGNSLGAAGFPKEAIRTSRFSSSPQYGWLGDTPDSYKVINRMAITIEKESQLETVARLADQNQGVELSDTTFEHSRELEYNDRVKSKALARIMEQKANYEKTLGVILSPVGIHNSNIEHRATRGAIALEEVVVTASRKEKSDFSSQYSEPERQTSSFDEIQYEADISVDFKIQ